MKCKKTNLSLILLSSLIYSLPLIILIFLIYKYGYRFPYWDEILYVPLYSKLREGYLNLSDLLFFQNDHRPLFPRIWTLILAWITNWNELFLLYSSAFTVVIVFLIFISQVNKIEKVRLTNTFANSIDTIGAFRLSSLIVGGCFSLLLFSWSQMENWVWGLQLMVFMGNASAIISFYLLSRYKLEGMGIYLGMIFGLVSTFSYASGLLVWISAMPLIISKFFSDQKKNLFPVVIWVLVGVFVVVTYLAGYNKPGISEVGRSAGLKDYLSYFLLFIGSPLNGFFSTPPWHGRDTINPRWFAYFFGIFGVICYLVILYLLWRVEFEFSRDSAEKENTVGEKDILFFWISVSLFSLLSGLVITYGRAGLGVGQALSSRYISSSVMFWCSLIGLVAFYFEKKKFRFKFLPTGIGQGRSLATAGLIIFCILYLGLIALSIRQNERWHNIVRWKNLGWFALCAGYDGKLYWTDLWGTQADFIDPTIVKNEIFPIFKRYNLCGYRYYSEESVKKELSNLYLQEAKYFVANKLWKPAICYLETALYLNHELKDEVEIYRGYIPQEMFRLYEEYQNRH